MASSMMDAILALVTPDLRQAIASRLGESAQTVQSGLSATTAATLGGLAAKAGDSGFLSQIMNVAATANTQNVLGSLTATPSGAPSDGSAELADRFLPMVLGAQQGEIASAIAQHAALSASSVNSLLKMAALLCWPSSDAPRRAVPSRQDRSAACSGRKPRACPVTSRSDLWATRMAAWPGGLAPSRPVRVPARPPHAGSCRS